MFLILKWLWYLSKFDLWYMSVSKLWELVMDREAWRAVIRGVEKSRIRLSAWTELNTVYEPGYLSLKFGISCFQIISCFYLKWFLLIMFQHICLKNYFFLTVFKIYLSPSFLSFLPPIVFIELLPRMLLLFFLWCVAQWSLTAIHLRALSACSCDIINDIYNDIIKCFHFLYLVSKSEILRSRSAAA